MSPASKRSGDARSIPNKFAKPSRRPVSTSSPSSMPRSEERRVGKEGRSLCRLEFRRVLFRSDVTRVEAEWGRAIDPEQVRQALKASRFDIVTIVHAEIGRASCRERG